MHYEILEHSDVRFVRTLEAYGVHAVRNVQWQRSAWRLAWRRKSRPYCAASVLCFHSNTCSLKRLSVDKMQSTQMREFH